MGLHPVFSRQRARDIGRDDLSQTLSAVLRGAWSAACCTRVDGHTEEGSRASAGSAQPRVKWSATSAMQLYGGRRVSVDWNGEQDAMDGCHKEFSLLTFICQQPLNLAGGCSSRPVASPRSAGWRAIGQCEAGNMVVLGHGMASGPACLRPPGRQSLPVPPAPPAHLAKDPGTLIMPLVSSTGGPRL